MDTGLTHGRRRTKSRTWSAFLLVSFLTACAAGGRAGVGQEEPAGPTPLAQEDGGPLIAFPPCSEPPTPAPESEIQGLDLPAGAVVTAVERADPLVTVNGYVELPPVRIRQYYEQREDLEIFTIEDEILEAEVLFGDGVHRNYVKARAVCMEGSSLLVVVAPELDADGLPVPPGASQPPTAASSGAGSAPTTRGSGR